MKNIKKFLIAMFVLFVAFSCSDDDNNGIGNTALLINRWKVVSVNNLPVKEYSGGDDIYLTFEEEGDFTITWVSSDDSESEYGDWYWVDDNKSVKIVYDGDLGTMKVDKLTLNELWLYKENDNALFKCEVYDVE